MRIPIQIKSGISVLSRFRIRFLLWIALAWTLLDQLLWVGRPLSAGDTLFAENPRILAALGLRAGIVFVMSLLLGWLILFRFSKMFRNQRRPVNFILKTLILIAGSFVMNLLSQFAYFSFIQGYRVSRALQLYWELPSEKFWLIYGVPSWLLIFLSTQLLLELNQKYSPGVFRDILIGRYRRPQNEHRIILFLDLIDSTPIAEKLGHKNYFLFIKDFVQYVTEALLAQDARIYQYVGDEIVASWPINRTSGRKAIAALIAARKNLHAQNDHFRRKYGVIPKFQAGLHAGEVTIGEIGVIKRDLAMSGDTMNTTARIRTACRELRSQFTVSRDFLNIVPLSDFQMEPLGSIELKGKKEGLELFALKV